MSLKLHFLNVGDGDCTIVDFPERYLRSNGAKREARVMMVDIHHHDDHETYEHVSDYYKANFSNGLGGVRPIFRYIATHPHEDHLTGFNDLMESIPILNFWDVEHQFEPDGKSLNWTEYKKDWDRYIAVRGSAVGQPRVLRYLNTTAPAPFWDEDGIEVLAPSQEIIDFVHTKEDGTKRSPEEIGQVLNNISYVLLITFNGKKILLASDAEAKTWEHILKNHADKIKNIDILKAAHHGRESGFHEEAVKLMNPKHIVFSMAEDCEHGVPEKYKKAAPQSIIYHTHENGSFILECDFDGNITLSKPLQKFARTLSRPVLRSLS